jgi:hypothetical protein
MSDVDSSKNSAQKAGPKKTGHRFKKGDPRPKGSGRKRGQQNRITVALRDAVITAAELLGEKLYEKKTGAYTRRGKGGLIGYCVHLGKHHDAVFATLLGKVLPMHVAPAVVNKRTYLTEQEVRAMCAERGIPFEPLLDLAVPVPLDLLKTEGEA